MHGSDLGRMKLLVLQERNNIRNEIIDAWKITKPFTLFLRRTV